MNELLGKIKELFRGGKKNPEFEPSQKSQSESRPFIGADEISRSIRESEKSKLRKGLWRNVFHF